MMFEQLAHVNQRLITLYFNPASVYFDEGLCRLPVFDKASMVQLWYVRILNFCYHFQSIQSNRCLLFSF